MLEVSLQEILLTIFYKLFYNFKTFKLSFKYPKHKFYLLFFTNYFYNFKRLNYH
jgi:hypothetical protein